MKDYTTDNPTFSEIIKLLETTDRAHADVLNAVIKPLFENTLALRNKSNHSYITDDDTAAVYRIGKDSNGVYIELFSDEEDDGVDKTAMTAAEVEAALATTWNGESSDNPYAMSAEEVQEAIETEWTGETSVDETALSAEEIAKILT